MDNLIPADTPAPAFLAPQGSAIATIQQNKEVVNTLASIWIAKQFPRDLAETTRKVKLNCSRYNFAQQATYAYPRGKGEQKTIVTGASIRLAESLLAAYGNAEAGWKIVSTSYDHAKGCGISHCEAFCFDKESNVTNRMQFDVPHWRDTKKGGYALTDERDIYELCANQAARRKRSVILQTLPAWLIEEALQACNDTINGETAGTPLEDLIRRTEAAFAAIGVTRAMLERHLGHNMESTTKSEIVLLGKNYNAIKDGHARVAEIFPAPAEPEPPAALEPTAWQAPAAATQAELPTFGQNL